MGYAPRRPPRPRVEGVGRVLGLLAQKQIVHAWRHPDGMRMRRATGIDSAGSPRRPAQFPSLEFPHMTSEPNYLGGPTGKAAVNETQHGVAFDEAITVFDDPLARILIDGWHSEAELRETINHHSRAGRLLLVALAE